MNRPHLCLWTLATLIFIFGFAQPAEAQSGVDLITGVHPFGSYQLSDVDTVYLSNGHLTIDIPLISYPQRGKKLGLKFVLHYHNSGKILGGMAGCLPSIFGGGCSAFPWDSGFSPLQTKTPTPNAGCTLDQATLVYSCSATVNMPDGATLPMAPIGSLSFRSLDGSNYRLDMPPGFPVNRGGPSPNMGYTLTDPDGIRYTAPASGYPIVSEDPNGNQITYSGANWTDTLNRTIPGLPPFPVPLQAGPGASGSTTDFSGCAGPLPIAEAVVWNPPGLNGGAYNLKFCLVNISETMPPDQYNAHPNYPAIAGQLQSIVLPDGTNWIFQYATDGSGNLSQITLPSGGTISYTWINPLYPNQYPEYIAFPYAVASRTLNPNDGNPSAVWQYHYTRIFGQDFPVVTRVTDPAGNDTVHTFGGMGAFGVYFQETKTDFYQGSSTIVKSVQKDYKTVLAKNRAGLGIGQTIVPIRETTIWPNGLQSKIEYDYDSGFVTQDSVYNSSGNWAGACSNCGGGLFGEVVATREYDLGSGAPGALLRTISTPHLALFNQDYNSNNLFHLISGKVITDASNATVESTSYGYDEANSLVPSGITTQHNNTPATGSHRGNLSSVSRWLNTTGGSLVSIEKTFDTGESNQSIDPLGHTVTHTYDVAYLGGYLTQTCDALNHCVSGTYDLNTGLQTSLTDENASYQASGNTPGDPAHTTNYSYDSTFRITDVLLPPDPTNGNIQPHTKFTYSPSNIFPATVVQSKPISATINDILTTTYDGLGRPTKTQHATPNCSATVDTIYDGLNRTTSISNPYCTTTDATYGTTITAYDALGRITSVTLQDKSVFQNQFADPVAKTTIDEAGHQLRTVNDALGRLVEVDEPSGLPIQTNNHATMQQDGNFVVYNSASVPLWSTGTGGTNAQTMLIQDDGNLVAYIFKWQAGVYAAGSPGPFPPSSCSIGTYLVAGQFLFPGQCITSPRGQYFLLMNTDGNFFIYDWAHAAGTWGPGTQGHPGAYAVFQTYGNLVVYDVNGTPLWDSGTSGTYAERLDLEDDGRIIIWKSAWNSGTSDGQFNGTVLAHPSCDVGTGVGSTGILGTGQCAVSPNGRFELLMQIDGNLVIYDRSVTPNAAIWSSKTNVSPVDPSVALRTLYTYDALGNLTCVEQHGDATTGTGCSAAPSNDATSPWRVRRFTYDSLSRLVVAKNPESGTITYTYDADGNLLQKTSPAPNPNPPQLTQTVSYCYDELHRVTKRDYQAHTFNPPACPITAPVVTYSYDSGANAKGHLTSLTDQAGTATYTYDTLGRLSTETRPIAGISKNMSYTYNLDGSIKTITYPSGRVVTYTPDSAGRLLSAVDSNGTQYVSNATYYASGAEYQRFMPHIYFRTDLNPRLQVSRYYSDNGQVNSFFIDKTYNYGPLHQNNGNVMSIANNKDSNRTQTFSYDTLNRITSGSSSANTGTYSWGENYSIDAWGNLQISPMGGKAHGGYFPYGSDVSNRPAGLGYDAAGNLTNYNAPGQYVYDQENRLSSTAGMTYTYDGNGERVLKSNTSTGAAVKRYWSMGGNTLAEGDGSGNLTAEYIYFGGKRVARIDLPANTAHYYLSDHLGSTSIVTNAAGVIEEESDYSPFGTEVVISGPGVNELKFTGKRRDPESQLDYFGARYFANLTGRFETPDAPFADQNSFNPQSWNLYSYVQNNPVTAADRDGRKVEVCTSDVGGSGGQACGWVSDDDYRKAREADAKQGIIAPGGNHPDGDITCGGQVCGNVRWESGNHLPDREAMYSGEVLPRGELDVAGAGFGRLLKPVIGAVFGRFAGGAGGTATGEMIVGPFGTISRAALQAAADSGGETVTVVTRLTQAPVAGRALSTAVGDGAEALASAAREGGTTYTAQIPKKFVDLAVNKGLARESTTSMGGTVGREVRFAPAVTEFIVKFFH